MCRRAAVACLLAVLPSLPLAAQELNPYEGDRTAVRIGAALFALRCADCHGADARGVSGPDLTSLWAAVQATDAGVFRTIREGVPGTIMPATAIPEAELWALVTYLKSIGTVDLSEPDTGDAARGADAFGRSCARCHRVAGSGGTLGPDLTRIARVRTLAALRRAVRDPGASVPSGYEGVTLVTREGERVRGVLKSEDAFSLRIMDTRQRLQGYRRSDLSEVTPLDGSLMPAFGPDRLPDETLEDILSHLRAVSQEGGR